MRNCQIHEIIIVPKGKQTIFKCFMMGGKDSSLLSDKIAILTLWVYRNGQRTYPVKGER
jgi:hypothetical protein